MMLTPLAQMLEQSESLEVELSLIDAFPEHPFRVQADEDMERLIGSIQESGVMVPVILRRKRTDVIRPLQGTAAVLPAGSFSWNGFPQSSKSFRMKKPCFGWWNPMSSGPVFCPARKRRLTG